VHPLLKCDRLWQKAHEDEWIDGDASDDSDWMDIDDECKLSRVIPQEWSDSWWKIRVNQAGYK
jgi:hypothetical protein